jgi:hypothetical protein
VQSPAFTATALQGLPDCLKRSPCRGHFRANANCCSNGQEKLIGSFSGKQMHSGEKCPWTFRACSALSIRLRKPRIAMCSALHGTVARKYAVIRSPRTAKGVCNVREHRNSQTGVGAVRRRGHQITTWAACYQYRALVHLDNGRTYSLRREVTHAIHNAAKKAAYQLAKVWSVKR